MLCPKCNKKMKIICRFFATIFSDESPSAEVLGRCENCVFDATWEIKTYSDGHKEEFNLKQYFFG